MLKNYLKTAVRNFVKHPGYSFINVFGLAVGIACCVLIVLFIRDELSYDDFHLKGDRIFRVGLDGFVNNNRFYGVSTPAPMAKTLVDEYPEIEAATRIQHSGFPVFRYEDKVFSEEKVFWVDGSFFDVFTVDFIQGDPKTALVDPATIVLTRSMVKKYFGEEDPIGKTVNSDKQRDYQVTGVVEDSPRNSHFHYDFLASLSTYENSRSPVWISNNYLTYFVIHEGFDATNLENRVNDLVKKYVAPQIEGALGINIEQFYESGGKYGYFIQPMRDIHLRSNLEFELEANGDITYVYIFALIALGILIVAVINFINLATAHSSTRAREVGVRKTLGSDRGQLMRQFLGETIMMSFLAMLLGLGIAHLLLPAFNSISGKALSIPYFSQAAAIPLLLLMVVVIGLAAGIYPAFFLASFKPVEVLKTENAGRSKKSNLRSVLVVFQFAISIILIVGTLVVSRQMSYIRNMNMGFNKEQIVIVKKTDDLREQIHAFRQELAKSPQIINSTNTNQLFGEDFGSSVYSLAGSAGEESHLLSTYVTDADFVKTYEIEMAAGRYFDSERKADREGAVINEAALRDFGIDDPVGRQIISVGPTPDRSQTFTILGVMKDFNYQSVHSKIAPMIIHYFGPEGGGGRNVAVRIRPENVRETLAFMEKAWKQVSSNQAFEYEFFDDHFAEIYQAEERTRKIFVAFSVLAIILACLGLLGLASFITGQRTKEIGIRKVMGATVAGVVMMLSKQYTKWIVLGNLIAWPVAYFAMERWMRNFAYRAGISAWSFVGAAALVLVIALLTVSFRTVKAALANPADSLKYE